MAFNSNNNTQSDPMVNQFKNCLLCNQEVGPETKQGIPVSAPYNYNKNPPTPACEHVLCRLCFDIVMNNVKLQKCPYCQISWKPENMAKKKSPIIDNEYIKNLNKASIYEIAYLNTINGNLQNLEIMRNAGCNFKELDKVGDGLCLTRIAIKKDNQEIFTFLTSEGCDCDIYSISKDYGMSLIHFAANEGHINSLKLILEKAEKDKKYFEILNICDKDNNKASHYAAKNGHIDFLNFLKYQCFQGMSIYMDMNNYHQTPLDLYIKKIDINIAESFCFDLIKEAISFDNVNLLNLILNKGIIKNNEKSTIINYSIEKDKPKCLSMYLNRIGYHINDSLLEEVISKQKPKSLKVFLKLFYNSISEDKINNLIIKTIQISDHHCLEVIVDYYKINLNNYLNSNNDTAPIIAINNQKINILKWLSKKGCNMKIKNKNGESAFILAINFVKSNEQTRYANKRFNRKKKRENFQGEDFQQEYFQRVFDYAKCIDEVNTIPYKKTKWVNVKGLLDNE